MKSFSVRPGQLTAIVAVFALLVAISVGQFYGIALSVLLLAAGALGLVIWLLWSSVRNLTGDTPLTLDEALGLGAPSPEEEQKRAVLRALKDLEYEKSVGKISEADYRDYSARYREEARRLMERVDASLAQARELAEKLMVERVAAAGLASAGDAASPKAAKLGEEPDSMGGAKAPAAKRDDDDTPDSDDDDDTPDSDDDDDTPNSDDDDDTPDSDATPSRDEDAPEPGDPKPVTGEANGRAQSTHSCAACAGTNEADAKFCKHCGAALDPGSRASRAKRAREEKTP